MLFGAELRLTHEASGVSVCFNATDALREWKARLPRSPAPFSHPPRWT